MSEKSTPVVTTSARRVIPCKTSEKEAHQQSLPVRCIPFRSVFFFPRGTAQQSLGCFSRIPESEHSQGPSGTHHRELCQGLGHGERDCETILAKRFSCTRLSKNRENPRSCPRFYLNALFFAVCVPYTISSAVSRCTLLIPRRSGC